MFSGAANGVGEAQGARPRNLRNFLSQIAEFQVSNCQV